MAGNLRKANLIHYETCHTFSVFGHAGAGKTTMAAELSRRLLEDGKIDFILCFSQLHRRCRGDALGHE